MIRTAREIALERAAALPPVAPKTEDPGPTVETEVVVWVVEFCPSYESGCVRGVYDTAEAGMAANPGEWESTSGAPTYDDWDHELRCYPMTVETLR